MAVKIYAPKGVVIVEIKDETDSLAFDITRVRSGKIHSMRSEDNETVTSEDNVYAIFGPNYKTLDLENTPGKLFIAMNYSNVQAFLKDDKDE